MDLRTLEPRLENWARAQRSSGYGGPDISSVEGRYRGGGYRESHAKPEDIDLLDAQLVNDAWKTLMPFDKDVLRMHYVWRAHSNFICRRMKLKQGREHEHVWDFALFHAHEAIDSKLAKSELLAKSIKSTYNPRRLLIPA